MKTMGLLKTLSLAGVALLALSLSSPVQAHPGHWGGADGKTTMDEKTWEQMTRVRNMMHQSAVSVEPTENGIIVSVTSGQAELVAVIQQELSDERGLQAPLPETKITINQISEGVEVAFTSENTVEVEQLKQAGTHAVYALLRNQMHQLMIAQGHGPGAMHGQGMGPGMNPGWMHGQEGGRGYGPGAMHGQGMGPGMNPGWMHGQGNIQGTGPISEAPDNAP